MKWLHNLLKGASLTTALFIFQACYGTPRNALTAEEGTAPMTFCVISHADGKPLEGIRITSTDGYYSQYEDLGVTGPDGRCSVRLSYIRNVEGPYVHFEDPEGLYSEKDTVLFDLREREIVIKMDQ